MQEVEGSTPTGGTCPNDFSDPIDQDIRTQWALSWKLVVSEWRSVIAVSLNVGGGVRLIKPAKLCMCTQTLQTQRGRTHGAGCVRQWFRTAEPLGERRYENWNTHTLNCQGEPGLVDRVLALHAGSRGFDSYRVHMSERFFWSNRPGYPHPVSSELENSSIRVAVGGCSVTERRRWRPPYQTGKTVHVHVKHYKHNEDGRTAAGVCGNGSVPLSHSGNVVTRTGIHTHTHTQIVCSQWIKSSDYALGYTCINKIRKQPSD